MKLESQVCTLEQAKKLKELGLFQFGNFHYVIRNDKAEFHFGYDVETKEDGYHAFSVAELGKILPEWLTMNEKEYRLNQWKNPPDSNSVVNPSTVTYYATCYQNIYNEMDRKPNEIFKTTEAETRAALLIYLLENKLVDVEACNKRLVE